jgi:hypothetical protein
MRGNRDKASLLYGARPKLRGLHGREKERLLALAKKPLSEEHLTPLDQAIEEMKKYGADPANWACCDSLDMLTDDIYEIYQIGEAELGTSGNIDKVNQVTRSEGTEAQTQELNGWWYQANRYNGDKKPKPCGEPFTFFVPNGEIKELRHSNKKLLKLADGTSVTWLQIIETMGQHHGWQRRTIPHLLG